MRRAARKAAAGWQLEGPLLYVTTFADRLHRRGAAEGLAFIDVDACVKGILDAVEHAGIIETDAQVSLLTACKAYDKESPGIAVHIAEIDEVDAAVLSQLLNKAPAVRSATFEPLRNHWPWAWCVRLPCAGCSRPGAGAWDTAEVVGTGYGILHAGGRRLRRAPSRARSAARDRWVLADSAGHSGRARRRGAVGRGQAQGAWRAMEPHAPRMGQRIDERAWCSYQQCRRPRAGLSGWSCGTRHRLAGGLQGWTANSLDELGKIGGPESQERRRGCRGCSISDRLRYLTPQ